MAKLYEGAIKLASTIQSTGAQPLDDRVVVKTFADLKLKETFGNSSYVGMVVAVTDESKLYVLTKADVTAEKAWKSIGGTETVVAKNHTEAVAKSQDLTTGQLIKVSELEGDFAAGFYIVDTPGNISLLATSTGNKDEVAALKGEVDTIKATVGTKGHDDVASTGLVKATEDNAKEIATLKGEADIAGSVKHTVNAAKEALVGTPEDTKESDTIKGAKKYADEIKKTVEAHTVNGKAISTDPTLIGSDIAITGYTKPEAKSALSVTDTLNVALGKLEAGVDANANALKTLNGADSVSGSVANAVKTKIETLDFTDSAVTGQYVSKVDQVDGKISVTRELLPEADKKGAAAQALSEAKAYTDTLANGAVKTNTEAIATLNGAEGVSGSVAHSVKAAKTELETKIAKNAEDIKTNADAISALSSATHFIGITKTEIVDKQATAALNTDKYSIPEKQHTPVEGDVVIYGSKEFIASGKPLVWHELGDTSAEAGRIDALETTVGKTAGEGLQKKVSDIETSLATGTIHQDIESVKQSVLTEKGRAEAKEQELQQSIAAVDNKLGPDGEIGSAIAGNTSAIAQEVTNRTEAVNALSATVDSKENALKQSITETDNKFGEGISADNTVSMAISSAKESAIQTAGTNADNKISAAISEEVTRANQAYVKQEGYIAYTGEEKQKLAGLNKTELANKIEAIQVNGKAVAIDPAKTVNLTLDAADIKGGKFGQEGLEDVSTVSDVLANIYAALAKVEGAKISSVTASDVNEIVAQTSEKGAVTLGLKKETDIQAAAAGHNIVLKSGKNGLYAEMYYDEDDTTPAK